MRFQENVIPETSSVTPTSIIFYDVIRQGCHSVARPTVVTPFKDIAVSGPRSMDRRLIDAPFSLRETREFLKLIVCAFPGKAIIENRDIRFQNTHTCFAEESRIFLSINRDKTRKLFNSPSRKWIVFEVG